MVGFFNILMACFLSAVPLQKNIKEFMPGFELNNATHHTHRHSNSFSPSY